MKRRLAVHFFTVVGRFYRLWGILGLPCAVHLAWSACQQIADSERMEPQAAAEAAGEKSDG